MFVIDAAEAGVAGAATFVQQQSVLFRPSAAFVEAYLNAVMRPPLLRVWIGEQQHRLRLAPFAVIKPIRATIAVGFNQPLAVCRVRYPGLAQITSYGNRAELRRAFCPAVQHDRTV